MSDAASPDPRMTADAPGGVVAVLLAGGIGARLALPVPKQLVEIAGRTLLEHALRPFHDHPAVTEIWVMMAAAHVAAAERVLAEGDYGKVRAVLEGGDTRAATTRRALAALDRDEGLVLLHDAARPLVSRATIDACLAALRDHAAVTPALASTDTLVEIEQRPHPEAGGHVVGQVVATPDRRRVHRVQTPQGFSLPVIREAHRRAADDPDFIPTDDSGVVLRYLPEVPVAVVAGDARNIKVTDPVDLTVAACLLDA